MVHRKKINCLSYSLKYVLSKQKLSINEKDMMLDERTLLINPETYDTGMSESIRDWMKKNLDFHTNRTKLENVPNSLINIPVYYLTYADVYKFDNIKDTFHYIVLLDLNKIYDGFIPTLPISETTSELSLLNIPECTQLIIDRVHINTQYSVTKPFNGRAIIESAEFFWEMLIKKVPLIKTTEANREIVKLAEGDIYGSRLFLKEVINSSASTDYFKQWEEVWFLVRINMYKYGITGKTQLLEDLCTLLKRLYCIDINLLRCGGNLLWK